MAANKEESSETTVNAGGDTATDQGVTFTGFSDTPSLENIRQLLREFCAERNWNQYHTPRNLLLAMVGEVGELAEIFQWKGEVKEGIPDFTDKERHHVGQEMSDILLYLIRLADKCHIDLPAAAAEKLKHNAEKYPPQQVYGRSEKYTEYSTNRTPEKP